MMYLSKSFEDGLHQPFRFISEKDALHDACELVGTFTSPYSSSYERQVAMYGAGRNIGVISDLNTAGLIKDIFVKCSYLHEGEVILLTSEEKAFIKAAIEGTYYRPFYD